MQYLKTTEREGHPLTLDDAGFIQDAFKDALNGFLKGFEGANNSFIITGCVISVSGGDIVISAGWVVLNGEIYEVEAGNFGPIAFLAPAPYWKIEEIAVAPSPVYYEDNSLKNVHLKRRATLTGIDTGGLIKYSDTKTFKSLLHDLMLNGDTDFTMINSWDFGNLPVANAGYRKEGNRVFLRGDIRFTGGAVPLTNLPFAQLPVGYRPSINWMFNAVTGSSFNSPPTTDNYLYNAGSSWIRIDTDGYLYADASNGNSISLGGISFNV